MYIFVFTPSMVLSYVGVYIDLYVYVASIFLSGVALFFSYGKLFRERGGCLIHVKKKHAYLYFFFLLLTMVFSVAFGRVAFFVLYPFCAFLFSLIIQGMPFRKGLFCLIALIGSVFVYINFVWTGFGRLLLAGWMIVPVIVFVYQYRLPFEKFSFLITTSMASIFASLLRFDGVSVLAIFSAVARDSTTAPLRYAQDVYHSFMTGALGLDFSGIFDQFLLLVLGVFPREWWPGKPYGFGYEYTLQELSPDLAEAGHSIAALFIGEHLYYLGPYLGFFSAFLAILLVVLIFNFFHSFGKKTVGGIYTVPASMWVMSFVWNGMATFSQRFQQSVVIIVVVMFLIILRRRLKKLKRGVVAG